MFKFPMPKAKDLYEVFVKIDVNGTATWSIIEFKAFIKPYTDYVRKMIAKKQAAIKAK